MEVKVVDLNRISSVDPLENNTRFLIPDAALGDIAKNPQFWREDLLRSLSNFHLHPSRLDLAIPLTQLIRLELKNGRPIRRTSDPARRESFQHWLALPDFHLRFEACPTATDPEPLRDLLGEQLEGIERFLPVQLQKRLRRLSYLKDDLLPNIAESVLELTRCTYYHRLQDLGIGNPASSALNCTDSILFRVMLAHNACGLRDFAMGSNIPKPEKLVNDKFDFDYAVIASYVDGLITNEGKLSGLYRCMRRALSIAENHA